MGSLPCRFLVSIALAGLSAAAVLDAAGPPPGGAAPTASAAAGAGSLAAQLWSWMRTMWPDSGCTIDLDGRCGNTAPQPGTTAFARQVRKDGGCGIDPGGGCASAVSP